MSLDVVCNGINELNIPELVRAAVLVDSQLLLRLVTDDVCL